MNLNTHLKTAGIVLGSITGIAFIGFLMTTIPELTVILIVGSVFYALIYYLISSINKNSDTKKDE